jgi:alpha-beta hydrolase superfamily lysophospholipase
MRRVHRVAAAAPVGAEAAAERLGDAVAVSSVVRANDGVELHVAGWSSESQPWAVVIFLHGIASHGGWFGETASDLSEQGVAVYAPDRRGSGRSGGRRGHLDRYVQALNDVTLVVRLAGSEHPGTPVFVAGSSWAAKLAVVYAATRPAPLSGLLLLGPGLLPRVGLSPARQLAVGVGHLVAPTARVAIPLTPELYTTTPRYLAFIRADPLRLLTATTRFFWETGRLDRRRDGASAGLRLPLLVLQGDDDPMMDVPATRRWFSALNVHDKTYGSYPGASHTLDFERDRAAYVADMLRWLSARVPPGSAGRRDGP